MASPECLAFVSNTKNVIAIESNPELEFSNKVNERLGGFVQMAETILINMDVEAQDRYIKIDSIKFKKILHSAGVSQENAELL